jgi:hypothetical protein
VRSVVDGGALGGRTDREHQADDRCPRQHQHRGGEGERGERAERQDERGPAGLRDRVQVVIYAYESGLVEPGSGAVTPIP